MRARVLLAVLAATLVCATIAQAQQPLPALPPVDVVVTTGEGVIQAVPDRAWITVIAVMFTISSTDE